MPGIQLLTMNSTLNEHTSIGRRLVNSSEASKWSNPPVYTPSTKAMTSVAALEEHQHDYHEIRCDNNSIEVAGVSSSFSKVSAPELLLAEQEDQDEYKRTSRRPTLYSTTRFLDFPSIKSHASTASLSRTTTSKPLKKKLSFSTISIRHYERILTDNPAAKGGFSIGIGWNYTQQPLEPLDLYEEQRDPFRARLLVGRAEKEEILLDLRYTHPQLVAFFHHTILYCNQPRQTNVRTENIEETLQSAGKRVKHLLVFPWKAITRKKYTSGHG